MKDVKRKTLAIFMSIIMLLTLIGPAVAVGAGNPGAPSGNGIQPEYVAGNPDAADLGITGTEYKIDENPANKEYGNGTLAVTITNANGNYFNWNSNIPIKAVIVKGGPNANVFYYGPNVTQDTILHAPINNDQVYGLSHVTFIYEVGNLVIYKEVTDSAGNNLVENNTPFNFKVQKEDTENFINATINGNGSTNIWLSAGVYTVTEVVEADSDFTPDEDTQSITVVHGGTATVTFVNVMADPPNTNGTLTINKIVENEEGVEFEDDNTPFEFTVTEKVENQLFASNLTTAAVLPDVIVNAGSFETLTLSEGTYIVTEVNIPTGYEPRVNPQEVTVTAGNNAEVTFNNVTEVEETEGTLTIEKIVLDVDDEVIADDDSVFTFTVTNNDTNETVTIVGNDEETITLPVGNYTVAEIDIPDGFVDPVDSQNAEITVATNTKVTFTNKEKATIIINPPPANVDDEEGTLTITKKVVDNDGKDVPEDNSTFTFVVTNNNTNEKTTVTIKGNGTRKLTLFAGRYTVKEINIPKEYKQGLAAQVVDVEDDEDTPITFTNKLLAEIEVDPELPKTNAADMFMLGLGFLVTTGGLVLRRKRR